VMVTLSGNADVTVEGQASTTLIFTAANWNLAQDVTVAAVNDIAAEGPESTSITLSATSSDPSYNNLVIAPVQVNITDDDHGASVVLDQNTPLTGGLGAQLWGTVAVSASSWSGTAALVTKFGDGLGVDGGRFTSQIDHNAADSSELFTFNFDHDVEDFAIRLGRMNPTENGSQGPEIGLWSAYNNEGDLVGQGALDPRQGTNLGSNIYDFVVDPEAPFDHLVFSAASYPGATGTSSDSSDYSIQRFAFDWMF
jgi:hypothetical protein